MMRTYRDQVCVACQEVKPAHCFASAKHESCLICDPGNVLPALGDLTDLLDLPATQRSRSRYARRSGNLLRQFWVRVDKTDACWSWLGDRTPYGYGRFSFRGRAVAAHRFAYELLRGPIPDGLVIDHLCRVKHCVNPAHLEPVTQRENVLRGESIPAQYARRTHCERCGTQLEALPGAPARRQRHCPQCKRKYRPTHPRGRHVAA